MPKKRSPGEGGLYELKSKGLWRGVIDVGYWPDGRRRQRSVTAKTKTAARAKLDAIRDEIKNHGAPLDKQTTVEAWAEKWLETVCKPHLKPNTYGSYQSNINTWIIPTIGKRKVALLKPSDVRLVVAAIMDSGRSASTALKAFNVLSGMLDAARMEGLCGRNVADDVVKPKADDKKRGSLSTEHALAVLQTAATDLDGTRWWVALLGGLRQAERLGAQIADLDLAQGIYKVEWTLDEIASEHGCGERVGNAWPCGRKQGAACPQGRLRVPNGFSYRQLDGRLCLVPPKSGRSREVPLIPQLVEALRRYLAATDHIPNPHGLIWRHEDGSPYLPGEDGELWLDLLHRAGVIDAEQAKLPRFREEGTPEPPTSHWARHTTATVLMELGVDAKIIGEIVGHGSEQVTRGYQHVSTPAARAAMTKLGEHFGLGELPQVQIKD